MVFALSIWRFARSCRLAELKGGGDDDDDTILGEYPTGPDDLVQYLLPLAPAVIQIQY